MTLVNFIILTSADLQLISLQNHCAGVTSLPEGVEGDLAKPNLEFFQNPKRTCANGFPSNINQN